MALVVFLRGVNVGGHRSFRPSLLARKLRVYDVENIGAAGTFVVWKPGSQAEFRSALLKNLPFQAEVVICDARDVVRLAACEPFGTSPPRLDVVRFVSLLPRAARIPPALPIALPPKGKWLVRLLDCRGRFVLGEYRRTMKTIGYLGQIDKLFGGKATTRNWNTILSMSRVIASRVPRPGSARAG